MGWLSAVLINLRSAIKEGYMYPMTPEERAEVVYYSMPIDDACASPAAEKAIIAAAIREAVEAERERCVLTMRSFTNVAMDKAAEAIRSPEEE
jgi:hypothetical protein